MLFSTENSVMDGHMRFPEVKTIVESFYAVFNRKQHYEWTYAVSRRKQHSGMY